MKLKKLFVILIFFLFSQSILLAEVPHFLNFKQVLNESVAGKKAQDYLKNKLENGIKTIRSKEKKIQEEEKKIIQQKKIISADEYKKKVTELRQKVSTLQKERNKIFGQYDHVRVYGTDFFSFLNQAGFKTKSIDYINKISKEEIQKFGLKKDIIPIGYKV